jgi:hypothetical protein
MTRSTLSLYPGACLITSICAVVASTSLLESNLISQDPDARDIHLNHIVIFQKLPGMLKRAHSRWCSCHDSCACWYGCSCRLGRMSAKMAHNDCGFSSYPRLSRPRRKGIQVCYSLTYLGSCDSKSWRESK